MQQLEVSILARRVGRALLLYNYLLQHEMEFQSSPGWLAGRCALQILI